VKNLEVGVVVALQREIGNVRELEARLHKVPLRFTSSLARKNSNDQILKLPH
jgi:hypothetical protein